MSNNFKTKLIQPIIYNFTLILIFLILTEAIFGQWFDKNSFGPYMREHRMKKQKIEYSDQNEKVEYLYIRNYHGFRGEDIDPKEIDALIMGGSVIDERYKPDQYTITGYLNELLKNNNYDVKLVNAGIEAQSTAGIILGFKNWLLKIENLNPKFIIFYVGLNDTTTKENIKLDDMTFNGHLLNPDKREAFYDNLKTRSFFYDTLRKIKFNYFPRKNFIKYDGKIDVQYKERFEFINYSEALNNYDIKKLQIKYQLKLKNYRERIDLINFLSNKINAKPIFVTNIQADGHREKIFIMNHMLINHCKERKYYCIDVAKKLDGNINYWRDGTHTSKEGSEEIANLIFFELQEFLKKLD